MVFSSIIFLFLFLPLALLGYALVGKRLRNTLLLLVSLLFYAWGEQFYVFLMIASVCYNYFFGLLIDRCKTNGWKKLVLALAVCVNLAPLFYFKYWQFIGTALGSFFSIIHIEHSLSVEQLHLPIGISFFTFQAISYIVDVYRKVTPVQKNVLNMGLYIAFFPQLIAGPIVRYHDIAKQIVQRTTSLNGFAAGVERFVFGLSKKVLIANPMGAMADTIFALHVSDMSSITAWIGILCYTMQIYFDFSGYSDMAIGLGRMFGFRFLENFNYPYISRSIQEFWRRWHISLSNWFRDYLYIPLGGNRLGNARTCFNLLVVFFLCGLWHGASWNFIIWGLFHGLFLMLERGRFGGILKSMPRLLQHGYTLFVVVNAWVFFRLEGLRETGRYFEALYGFGSADTICPVVAIRLDTLFWLSAAAGLFLSTPIFPWFQKKFAMVRESRNDSGMLVYSFAFGKMCILGVLLIYCVTYLAAGSYNPFIYFRF